MKKGGFSSADLRLLSRKYNANGHQHNYSLIVAQALACDERNEFPRQHSFNDTVPGIRYAAPL